MNSSILVLIETQRGELVEISFECLSAARAIANSTNSKVIGLVLGKNAYQIATKLGSCDSVYWNELDGAELVPADIVAEALGMLIKNTNASTVLIGGTNNSLGLGSRLSAKTNIPFVNFAQKITPVDSDLVVTCRFLGGKILADVRLKGSKGIIVINSGAFAPDLGKTEGTPHCEKLDGLVSKPRITFKKFIQPAAGDIDITKMDVLVSIGRGIQNPDNIPLAEELAKLLNGAVSASRPVVDQGWLPLTRQVGKSGMTVKPKLYLALGISGAPEHWEGMKDSNMIIAVNTDTNAPIFSFAHYGVVADIFDFIPVLKDAIQKHKK
jgi:electron transfer flavoprotein alpha subunit